MNVVLKCIFCVSILSPVLVWGQPPLYPLPSPLDVVLCNSNEDLTQVVDVDKSVCPLRCQMKVVSEGQVINVLPREEGSYTAGPEGSSILNVPSNGMGFGIGVLRMVLKRQSELNYRLMLKLENQNEIQQAEGPLGSTFETSLRASWSNSQGDHAEFECWRR